MQSESEDGEISIDLFLRTDGPAAWERQGRIVNRLNELVAAGVIDAYRTEF